MVNEVSALVQRSRKRNRIVGLDGECQSIWSFFSPRALLSTTPHQYKTKCSHPDLVHNPHEILAIWTRHSLSATELFVVCDLVSDEQLLSELAIFWVWIKTRS